MIGYPTIVMLAVVLLLSLTYKLQVPVEIASLVALMLLAGLAVAYELSIRPPKTPEGKIGLVLAITGETGDESLRAANDLGKAFRDEVNRSASGADFNIIFLPEFLSKRVVDTESATALLGQTRSHFMAYGDLRKRKEGGRAFNVLRLESVVRHSPIKLDVQKEFANEMKESLPLGVAIDCESDLSGFEVTSGQFASGAKFIIATAALVSTDFNLARQLLEELYSDTPLITKQGLALGKSGLPGLIRKRLLGCLGVVCQYHHWRWRVTKDDSEMSQALAAADRAMQIEPRSLDGLGTKAIAAFVLDGDVKAARRYTNEIAKLVPKSADWRYSLAFLAAYEGDMVAAWRWYKEAFGRDIEARLPIEIEEFVAWAVANEPDKVQLHYCLGLINLKRKGDRVSATRDFELFLEKCPINRFVDERKHAQRYLQEIEASTM